MSSWVGRTQKALNISPCFGKGSGLKHEDWAVKARRTDGSMSHLPLLRQGERIETRRKVVLLRVPVPNLLCLLFIHPRAPNLIGLRSAGTMPA